MFSKCKSSTAEDDVTRALMENSTHSSSFPNLATLAMVVPILPVSVATVYKRSFSSIKLVKTRLRSQLGCDTLDLALRLCIEGPERPTDENLEAIIELLGGGGEVRLIWGGVELLGGKLPLPPPPPTLR